MYKLLIFCIVLWSSAYAEDQDLCKYFKYCGNVSKSSQLSYPSNSASSGLNPANITSIRGFGLEAVYQPHNSMGFNFVTGNGKIGALISPSLENSFFGNRAIEIDDLYLKRKLDNKQYINKKINFAAGYNLIDKTNFQLNLGASSKWNPDIKEFNFGTGVNARFYFLNFGAYFYNDDYKIELDDYVNPFRNTTYAQIYNSTFYKERFSVATYTLGLKYYDLSLDYGYIRTAYNFYPEDTLIYLYSSSYSYKKYLFNLSIRKEYSSNYYVKDRALILQRKKESTYYGVQYLANRFFMFGLQYNNFLLNELSATLTIFI